MSHLEGRRTGGPLLTPGCNGGEGSDKAPRPGLQLPEKSASPPLISQVPAGGRETKNGGHERMQPTRYDVSSASEVDELKSSLHGKTLNYFLSTPHVFSG